MYSERRNTSGSGIVIVAVLAFICAGVWWLTDKYGSTNAGYVLVAIGVIGVVIIVWMLVLATVKTTMNATTQFNSDLAQGERYRQMTAREVARGDTAWHKAHAAISVLNERRVDQIAQQRAGLIVDQQRPAPQPQANGWDWENETADDAWNVMQ